MFKNHLWLMIGFVGQIMFFGRFFIQWLYSEKAKKSIFPVAFWYLSIAGGSLLFLYALHRQDPVFIVGQACGLLIYARNIDLIRRNPSNEQ